MKWDRRYQEKYGITTAAAANLPEGTMALIEAEEAGVTAANADEQAKGQNPVVQRLLGVSGDFGLAYAWALARTLRLADGPDEVHRETVAKLELRRHG